MIIIIITTIITIIIIIIYLFGPWIIEMQVHRNDVGEVNGSHR